MTQGIEDLHYSKYHHYLLASLKEGGENKRLKKSVPVVLQYIESRWKKQNGLTLNTPINTTLEWIAAKVGYCRQTVAKAVEILRQYKIITLVHTEVNHKFAYSGKRQNHKYIFHADKLVSIKSVYDAIAHQVAAEVEPDLPVTAWPVEYLKNLTQRVREVTGWVNELTSCVKNLTRQQDSNVDVASVAGDSIINQKPQTNNTTAVACLFEEKNAEDLPTATVFEALRARKPAISDEISQPDLMNEDTRSLVEAECQPDLSINQELKPGTPVINEVSLIEANSSAKFSENEKKGDCLVDAGIAASHMELKTPPQDFDRGLSHEVKEVRLDRPPDLIAQNVTRLDVQPDLITGTATRLDAQTSLVVEEPRLLNGQPNLITEESARLNTQPDLVSKETTRLDPEKANQTCILNNQPDLTATETATRLDIQLDVPTSTKNEIVAIQPETEIKRKYPNETKEGIERKIASYEDMIKSEESELLKDKYRQSMQVYLREQQIIEQLEQLESLTPEPLNYEAIIESAISIEEYESFTIVGKTGIDNAKALCKQAIIASVKELQRLTDLYDRSYESFGVGIEVDEETFKTRYAKPTLEEIERQKKVPDVAINQLKMYIKSINIGDKKEQEKIILAERTKIRIPPEEVLRRFLKDSSSPVNQSVSKENIESVTSTICNVFNINSESTIRTLTLKIEEFWENVKPALQWAAQQKMLTWAENKGAALVGAIIKGHCPEFEPPHPVCDVPDPRIGKLGYEHLSKTNYVRSPDGKLITAEIALILEEAYRCCSNIKNLIYGAENGMEPVALVVLFVDDTTKMWWEVIDKDGEFIVQ